MDLTPFYEEFEKTCRTANFAVVLAFVVIAFLCYRTIKDNSEDCVKKRQKALYIACYCLMLLFILYNYVTGPLQCKKDIQQQLLINILYTFLKTKVFIILNGKTARLRLILLQLNS